MKFNLPRYTMVGLVGVAEFEYPCEAGSSVTAEVNTTINLPDVHIPVIVANVTFLCGVELGEPTVLIGLTVPEPIGPIHGMTITDVEVSATATYWGELSADGKRWSVIGRVVQVEPMKPTLKAPGTERLKL